MIRLEAKNIGLTYKKPTINNLFSRINLTLYQGQSISITGASGSGKSSLLQVLGSLQSPTEGQVFINGKDLKKQQYSAVRNRDIGFIFQSYYLLDELSVIENILLPAKIARKNTKPDSRLYQEAMNLLCTLEMSDKANQQPAILSGGEKQRVAIARACINDSSIILADEPTGNLDRKTASIIQDILLTFCKQKNRALILVTHDLNFAKKCTKHFTLEDGLLKQTMC
jgi:lipoprotein-releasing system ATP-binding protein